MTLRRQRLANSSAVGDPMAAFLMRDQKRKRGDVRSPSILQGCFLYLCHKSDLDLGEGFCPNLFSICLGDRSIARRLIARSRKSLNLRNRTRIIVWDESCLFIIPEHVSSW